MENIIEMKNVSKQFKDKHALKRLNFSVREGEIFGFLGPSGAGKTTTIKILTSQLIPSNGEARIFNKDVYSLKKDIFKKIGVLSDNSGLYERLSVEQDLMLFADIYDIDRKNVYEILERVGLLEDKKKEAKKLSRGMKQRLMLARTLNQMTTGTIGTPIGMVHFMVLFAWIVIAAVVFTYVYKRKRLD